MKLTIYTLLKLGTIRILFSLTLVTCSKSVKHIFAFLSTTTVITTVFYDVTSYTAVEVYRSICKNYFPALKMEAARASESQETFYQIRQRLIPEDIIIVTYNG